MLFEEAESRANKKSHNLHQLSLQLRQAVEQKEGLVTLLEQAQRMLSSTKEEAKNRTQELTARLNAAEQDCDEKMLQLQSIDVITNEMEEAKHENIQNLSLIQDLRAQISTQVKSYIMINNNYSANHQYIYDMTPSGQRAVTCD